MYHQKYPITYDIQKGGNIKINMNKREYHRNTKSFHLISNYFKSNNKHLNWELIGKIKSNSPSEYDRKDSNIYQQKEYQLFPMEDFLSSNWSFLDNLLKQYQDQFEASQWYNDNKLSSQEFDNGNNYPVYIQRLKVKDKSSKFCIIGDIHSSLHSMISILDSIKNEYFQENMTFKSNRYILFLGDILDRGPYNMEVLFMVLSLNIIILIMLL